MKVFEKRRLSISFLFCSPRCTPSWLLISWVPSGLLFDYFDIILRLFYWLVTTWRPPWFRLMRIYLKNIICWLEMASRFSHTWWEGRNVHGFKLLKIWIVYYLKFFQSVKTVMKIFRILLHESIFSHYS